MREGINADTRPTTSSRCPGEFEDAAATALRFLATTIEHFGSGAPMRQAKVFLTVAAQEPATRKDILKAVGGTIAPILDDLLKLGPADRQGKQGLKLIRLDRVSDSHRLVYVLTPKGRRAAERITACILGPHADEQVTAGDCGPAPGEQAPESLGADPAEAPAAPSSPGVPEVPSIAPRNRKRSAKSSSAGKPRRFRYKGVSIRAVEVNGHRWFVAGDICKCLGRDTSAGTAKALRYIDEADRMTLLHSQVPAGFLGERCYQTNGVSLAGLLKLANRTKGPSARAFEKWVADRIIPQLLADRAAESLALSEPPVFRRAGRSLPIRVSRNGVANDRAF